ncbi:hypothetical protein Leryth_014257 [Lithospermum erythrorhizon]|nr:hypothetical protein Leryth_014257 [Lithospermum erythrorhizon]
MKSGEGFIDRSKVRILLCDNDTNSSDEVFILLCKCSYQVTKVKSPRQVIHALNAEGPDIDIILSEVDLPMSKGFKLLKYIMRDRQLQRIPVIMMSAQDEVSVVVKCLKYGAADYLLKPLRTNELLNLWTHMWRRRRILGLAEKNILNYDIDLVVSDPSDVNTNSATLFSDDTDDKSRKSLNPDINMSIHPEDESNSASAAALSLVTAPSEIEISVTPSEQCLPDVPVISDRRTGQIISFPVKSELKIGESSAFFTYVKSNVPKTSSQIVSNNRSVSQCLRIDEKLDASPGQVDLNKECSQNEGLPSMRVQVDESPSSSSLPNSFHAERSCTPSSFDFSQVNSKESTELHLHSRHGFHSDALGYPRNGFHHDSSGQPRNEFHHNGSGHPRYGFHHDAPGYQPPPPYPYYIPGLMNQSVMPSSQFYQKAMPDPHNNSTSAMVSQNGHVPQFPPHMPGMAPYPYFPVGMCLQPGQMPTHQWPPYGNGTYDPNAASRNKVDRREVALMKFRQKRKERCFDKKIRYVNRKRLADRRPRVRGQFVRKVNGITVDLNGQPASVDDDDDEYEEYDDEEEEATT